MSNGGQIPNSPFHLLGGPESIGDHMNPLEFRFYYFTPSYDQTVAFYRDILRFEIYRTWDRPGGDRGTIFRSPNGAGLIEIEAGDQRPSIHGGFYVEVDDLDHWYDRVREAGAPIRKELGDTSYGHRNFKTVDPNGVEVSFFQYLGSGKSPPIAPPKGAAE